MAAKKHIKQKDQAENSGVERLKPWQFQPGQSGNPAGRPPGRSLKDFAKSYLSGLSDDERIAYFEGIDKLDIWHMAEGKPEGRTDITTLGEKITTMSEAERLALLSLLNDKGSTD